MNPLEYKFMYESPAFREKESPEAILGAIFTPKKTWFRVWVPDADAVYVRLYSNSEAEAAFLKSLPMKRSGRMGENAVWEVCEYGNLHGMYYTYEVYRNGTSLECVDIYARACGVNGKRGMIVDLARTNPDGWTRDAKWSQKNKNTVVYELHVKDFSYHQKSGIPPAHRGKYLAFTDRTKTRRGIRYLKHLGISHVHFLPVFDFASVDEAGDGDQFNWGYDPQNYNIPEGSYSTDPKNGIVRIREFKQMVQALHRAGIAVIMDVVYNHTFSQDSNFQVLAPYYYYRQREDGSFSNGSGCGNETASERPMFGKFICESILYWAEEYHIDGFRFDLMGLHDTDTMNRVRKELKERFPNKKIFLYGEPWTCGKSPILSEHSKECGHFPSVKVNVHKIPGIAIFCDNTRDAIKGNVFHEKEPGFVNGGTGLEGQIASAYKAWCDGGHDFAPVSPSQIISYVSAHDNLTLWDKLVLTSGVSTRAECLHPDGREAYDFLTKREEILDMNRLAAGIVFTCLGIPFFQAGEEFGRTKYGDENSYRSSASINCLDWCRRDEFHDLVEYYRGLIALRGAIPLYQQSLSQNLSPIRHSPDTIATSLHSRSFHTLDEVTILYAEKGRVVVALDLDSYETKWRKVYITANASDKTYQMILPEGEYQKLVDKHSSWLWKRPFLWRKIKKDSHIINTAPKSIGIWGEIR